MADWPPVAPVQATPSPQEREKTYLLLVDMFVDIVEPDIIQMVLQNRNWNVDAALEDIMILTNSSQPDSAQHVNKKCITPETRNQHKVKKNIITGRQDENVPSNKFLPSYTAGNMFLNPQDGLQVKPKKPTHDKPFQFKVPVAKKGSQSQLQQPFIEQYNYVKATKVPFDRAVMLIKDGVKVMILLRGPPGCGKSYLARKLLLEGGIEPSAHKRHIFSSDEFFVQNNVYVFVPELLSQAHLWNQRSVAAAVREEVSPVIIDNTNIQAWEMRVYAEMAVSAGYDLEIVEPDTWWFKRDGELAKRNVHGVPKAKIRQMIERYERNITVDMLMKQFDLRYPLSKVPPQPARNCKWRDKLSNQRNNKPKKKKSNFSPKPQSNLSNINSVFQSFQINSSDFSQVENDFAGQNSSTTNICFPYQVNSNEIRSEEESKIYSEELRNKEETKPSSSFKNGDSTQGVFSDEGDTNKLFENLMINSSSFLKSFNEPSKPSQDPVKVPEQSNVGVSSGISFYKSKDSFDFMAETKKLLEALNKPSHSQAQLSNFCPEPSEGVLVNGAKENLELSQLDVPGNILVCNESEILLLDEKYSDNRSESDENFNLEDKSNLSTEEKIRVAHDLVDSIIDKAINDTKGLDSNLTYVEHEKEGDRGLSWDYVIVNNDNTFIYQRWNSIPIGLPVRITDNIHFPIPNDTNAISTVTGTGYRCDVKDENIETIFSSDVDESEFANSEKEPLKSGCKLKLGTNSNEDLTLHNCLEGKSESYIEEKSSLLDPPEESVSGINSGLTDKNEEFHLDSGKMGTEQIEVTGKKLVETENNTNPNVFEMMKDILYTLGPLSDSYNSSFGNDADSNLTESKTSIISQDTMKLPSLDKYVNSCTIPDSFANWNVGGDWDFNKRSSNEELQPKPARSLRRPKLLTNTVKHQFNETDYSKYIGNWDTVSNPAETWSMESAVNPSSSKNVATALPQRSSPQRSRNNKKMTDSSTNTNYLDFSLVSDENLTGVKVLTGNINNIFSENVPEVKKNMAETLFLDKSTMTLDESATSVRSYDTVQITSLFPNIPEKYILDMVERCQGDIDWAVDVLLDSEHIIAPITIESEINSSSRYDDGVEFCTRQPEVISSRNVPNETSPKREPKSPTYEQTELKKLIESSVVFNKSHYSDKVLKVLKRKHPEYVHLIENSPSPEDRNEDKSETAYGSQDECKTEDEVDEVEEESSSSGCEVETEDDTMDLIMSSDLILQLQQKFGTSSLPKIADMTPIVKLPLSFARQLFGYIMDSLQSDMDEQQSLIEEMIARDEEVAKLLQFQDQNSRPQLQEVMDMEIALAMHRADQEEWKEKGNETLAAKLSRNILLEKFPQVDPKMLTEVLQAHNYSLSDTIDSLTLGLGMGPELSSSLQKTPQEPPKEEKERVTSIIVSDDVGTTSPAASSANPVSEAAVHRAQAASYYSLRMECLSKAHDAFRSGNKTVATYYSQLAQMHKERMEQSNSKAAACLFSSHKTGANTLDLHFLHIREAEVVLDMFLDEVVTYVSERNKRHQTVFLITGRGLRSVGGVSRIKPMVQRKLQGRGIPYNEVNPGMLSALVRIVTPLSYTL